jgi:hypothetical protein
VAWHPYQLNPDLPETGVDRRDYLERKFGGRSAEIYARISAVGAEVGIPFAFDRVARQPNTLAAHSLIALAGDAGLQDVRRGPVSRYFIDGAISARTKRCRPSLRGDSQDGVDGAPRARGCAQAGDSRRAHRYRGRAVLQPPPRGVGTRKYGRRDAESETGAFGGRQLGISSSRPIRHRFNQGGRGIKFRE